jgi:putative flavoprotein involved in K+ transport
VKDGAVDVAIIGAGQAGLATSWHLKQAGVDHLVLEGGRVGETWRTRRWDSFCLVTPNWTVQLPGAAYKGPDPDGFMPLAELIEHLDDWAASFRAPVHEHTPVVRMEGQPGGGFVLTLPDDEVRARSVVVATGAYQRAHRPPGANTLPTGVTQILAEEYRNPAALPPGNVLIVGSGQTGCQLAEELHHAGRKVFLSCGRCVWIPRRLEGRDTIWWMNHSGFMDRTPDQLPSPAFRLLGNPQTSGHDGGHDLHYRTLHAMGVELLGRYAGAEGSKIRFADDLADSVDFGDTLWAFVRNYIDAYCVTSGMPSPRYDIPPPFRIETRRELDVDSDGIGSVIWTSGYRPDYSWVNVPVFDDMGFPITSDGRSEVPGLYFMGVHWMRKGKSAILYGVGEDAEVVSRQVIGAVK